MDAKILEITREDRRFSYEAYEFVCEAVTFTQDRLGRTLELEVDDDPEGDHHVSGGELLRGACELAVREFGMMAQVVFRTWGIRTTDDFGEMVFKLIRAGRLSQSEQDDPGDFRDLFNLDQVLTESFEMTLGDTPRRGER